MSEKIGKCTECGREAEVLFDSCHQDGREKIGEDEKLCIDCMTNRDRGEIVEYINYQRFNGRLYA